MLQALAAKEKGNAAYKSKQFEEALKHYEEAISLDPNDMTYYNNKAGELRQRPVLHLVICTGKI